MMIKLFLIIVGSFSVFLGVIGIFLPLIPTTPFLLLSAYCFMKSSKKMHDCLLNNKYLGHYIRNYYEKKGISYKTKLVVITLLWLSISYSVFFIVDLFILRIILLLIAIIVTIHILKQNTLKISNEKK